MEPGEYEGLVGSAALGGYAAANELLQFMRLNKVSQPELTLLHGGMLLDRYPRKLGSELWLVMEQVLLAACAVGHNGWRDYCLNKLTRQWPSSVRVERLRGICKESEGDDVEAKKIYTKIINDKPEDTLTRKRLIAMLKQRGKIDQAIEELNKYLDTFSTDIEVWHELAELYIEAGSFARAAYCYEELMVSNPHSMYHVLTYAELLYSVGDYELARKYFSLACYLDGKCLRALWGLLAVNMALQEKDKGNEKLMQMQTFTNERLAAAYKNVGPHGKVAIAMLKDVRAAAPTS